jgi:hypothetical protein
LEQKTKALFSTSVVRSSIRFLDRKPFDMCITGDKPREYYLPSSNNHGGQNTKWASVQMCPTASPHRTREPGTRSVHDKLCLQVIPPCMSAFVRVARRPGRRACMLCATGHRRALAVAVLPACLRASQPSPDPAAPPSFLARPRQTNLTQCAPCTAALLRCGMRAHEFIRSS